MFLRRNKISLRRLEHVKLLVKRVVLGSQLLNCLIVLIIIFRDVEVLFEHASVGLLRSRLLQRQRLLEPQLLLFGSSLLMINDMLAEIRKVRLELLQLLHENLLDCVKLGLSLCQTLLQLVVLGEQVLLEASDLLH